MAVNRLLGFLVVLCFVAAACGTSADTAVPAGAGAAAGATDAPATASTGETAAEPTVCAAIEPVADRLPADADAPTDAWVAGVNAAGWDFHRHLRGNAVSSPVSIGVAFSLSRAGASSDTADGTAAAEIINNWVSGRTRGLIPVIVNQDAVQDQELILVNTVYLKADWRRPFLTGRTRDGEFTTDTGHSVTVPFMSDPKPIDRRYVVLDGADAVELPYLGGHLAMWLIVPHERDGLAAVEESLDSSALAGLSGAARQGAVDLTMPKWEQTLPNADLFEWLCPQGFCPGAGFDGIAPGIFMTSAVHGAKVIVDEKGTEAAAATAMVFLTSGPPPPDLTVVANRPFLWAIIHEESQAVLFVGRLVDPTA